MEQFGDKYLDKYFARGHLGGFLESKCFSFIFPVHIFQDCAMIWTGELLPTSEGGYTLKDYSADLQ